jgi:hypothetical protein
MLDWHGFDDETEEFGGGEDRSGCLRRVGRRGSSKVGRPGLDSTGRVDIFAFFECSMAWKDDEVCQTSKLAVSVKIRNSLSLMITFMDLLVKLIIHKLPRRELEPFVNSLELIFVDKDDKVFPAPQLAKLPSDDDVREFIRGYYRKISMMGKVVM